MSTEHPIHTATSCAGFTLVELLLYVSISGAMALVVSIFLTILISARVKNQTILEVEEQGIALIQRITQTVRNATDVNSPSQGTSSDALNLTVPVSSDSPTIFDLAGGVARMQEGSSAPISLTSPRIQATSFQIQNLGGTGTPGTIRIQLTLVHVNPKNKNEFNYTKTFIASATMR